jgi:hypothetical protein
MLGALAGTGPAVLYNRLNGLTFNPPGYTIVMYQSCMQNQNAGNPCGSFSTFESANGVYTTQLYGPEAPVSPTCSRTFRLAVACGATMSMSGVNENPTCVYSATLTLPEACGIDMTVGNEAASASGTVAPPTPSITRSGTASLTGTATLSATPTYTTTSTYTPTYTTTSTYTPTYTTTSSYTLTSSYTITSSVSPIPSVTSTPLFEMTPYPSRTVTPSIAATTSPLFMVTAFPTSSPVNVTAPSILDTLGVTPGSSTATILGAVAVGVLGIALIVGAIIYFRKGGTVGGLVKKFEENKETIKQVAGSVADLLPLSKEQKDKIDATIDSPISILPPEVQQVAGQVSAVAEKAKEYKEKIIDALPVSAEQKAEITAKVSALQEQVVKRIESSPIGVQVKSLVEQIVVEKPAAEPPVAEPPVAEPRLVTVNISTEELASLREFMASKQASKD